MSTATNKMLITEATGQRIATALEKFEQKYPSPILIEKTITENGIYNASSDDANGYSQVTVNVEDGILSGVGAPSSSLGSDGDIYVQRFPLPDNVSFVGYLESNGTQYIDTGVIGDQDTDIDLTMVWMANTWVMGTRTGTAAGMTNCIYVGTANNNEIGVVKTGSDPGVFVDFKFTGTSGTAYRMRTRTVKTDCNHYVVVFNNPIDTNTKMVDIASTYTTDGSMLIFGARIGGSIINGTVRIQRAIILKGGIPVKDYLPCLDANNVPCMWENIAGAYVHNSGSGTFAYSGTATPEEIPSITYVKASGAWRAIV